MYICTYVKITRLVNLPRSKFVPFQGFTVQVKQLHLVTRNNKALVF